MNSSFQLGSVHGALSAHGVDVASVSQVRLDSAGHLQGNYKDRPGRSHLFGFDGNGLAKLDGCDCDCAKCKGKKKKMEMEHDDSRMDVKCGKSGIAKGKKCKKGGAGGAIAGAAAIGGAAIAAGGTYAATRKKTRRLSGTKNTLSLPASKPMLPAKRDSFQVEQTGWG